MGNPDVRALGLLLVVLALACGPHGVRLSETDSELPAAQNGPDAPLVCEIPSAPQTRPLNLGALFGASPSEVVPLNTRGYNYRPEGVYSPRPPPSPAAPDKDD